MKQVSYPCPKAQTHISTLLLAKPFSLQMAIMKKQGLSNEEDV